VIVRSPYTVRVRIIQVSSSLTLVIHWTALGHTLYHLYVTWDATTTTAPHGPTAARADAVTADLLSLNIKGEEELKR
jgi:hypothetical protein